MKVVRWSALALASVLTISCVASLLPLFEDRYLVTEPALAGTWKGGDSGADTWTFEQDGHEYALIQHQAEFDEFLGPGQPSKKVPGDTARFEARLGRLGGNLFLDLYPASEGNLKVRNDLLNVHLIAAHTLARVLLDKDSLKLVFLDEDWISKTIENGRIKLTHVQADGQLVLTAPTAELQAFVQKFAGDPEAFPLKDAVELSRRK